MMVQKLVSVVDLTALLAKKSLPSCGVASR